MITPEFIAHEEFHTGKWFLPVKRPSWYYFKKGKFRHTITTKRFYESIDPPLKSLIVFLHKKGITTTPSCSGHYKTKKISGKFIIRLKKMKQKLRKKDWSWKILNQERNLFSGIKNTSCPGRKKFP